MKNIQKKLANMDQFVTSHVQSAMQSMKKDRQKGAGAVEYALVLGVITLLIVGLAGGMKDQLTAFFTQITTLLNDFIK